MVHCRMLVGDRCDTKHNSMKASDARGRQSTGATERSLGLLFLLCVTEPSFTCIDEEG